MVTVSTEGLVKIYFQLDSNEWHGFSTESLWATPFKNSSSGEAFVLNNSPFYYKGVSHLDVVRAQPRNDGLGFDFIEVLDHSGNSTYRILIDSIAPSVTNFDEQWQFLQKLGCTYESATHGRKKMYSIDVPATSDIYAVYSVLEIGERSNIWAFEEGHVGHPLKDE